MTTMSLLHNPRYRPKHKSKAPALLGNPQRRAVVIKSFETTPRKPNSAKRRACKVRLSTRRRTNVYLEGVGSNRLQPHSVVLVRGRGPRDLPGVRYHAIRGCFDFPRLTGRRKGRSKYGVKRYKEDIELSKSISNLPVGLYVEYATAKNEELQVRSQQFYNKIITVKQVRVPYSIRQVAFRNFNGYKIIKNTRLRIKYF